MCVCSILLLELEKNARGKGIMVLRGRICHNSFLKCVMQPSAD